MTPKVWWSQWLLWISQCILWESAPSVDEDFDTIHVPKTDVSVHYKVTNSHSYADYIPISVCMFDHHAHPRVIHAEYMNLIKKVIGPCGTYPSRCISSHIGINYYEGLKDKTSQDHTTVSEGPGMKGKYKYQRQTTKLKFYPHTMKLTNEFSNPTSYFTA